MKSQAKAEHDPPQNQTKTQNDISQAFENIPTL